MNSDVYCTNCGGSFVATLDLSLSGNHQITCPLCGHIHYRVVRDGEVTEERWASSSGAPVFYATTSTTYAVNTTFYATTTMSSQWLNITNITTS